MSLLERIIEMDSKCLNTFVERYPLPSEPLYNPALHDLKQFREAINMLEIYWNGWQDAKKENQELTLRERK